MLALSQFASLVDTHDKLGSGDSYVDWSAN